MIDASQYYIKNYSGDKKPSGVGGDGIISSLSEFSVSCADGVLSSFGMKKPSSNKYHYDYSCMEGDVVGGELLGSQELDESDLTELKHLAEGSGFKVKCDELTEAKLAAAKPCLYSFIQISNYLSLAMFKLI